MNEHDREKGVDKPTLVYSPITEKIYIAYKHDLIDVTEKCETIMEMRHGHGENTIQRQTDK